MKRHAAYMLSAITMLGVTGTAYAQAEKANVPKHDPSVWLAVKDSEGGALVHRKSGGICLAKFRDLKLVGVKAYNKQGTDDNCIYQKTEKSGNTLMTVFLYQRPDGSGSQEYMKAKSAIAKLNERGGVKTTEQREGAKRCFQAVVPKVGEGILKKRTKDGLKGDSGLQMGIAQFTLNIDASKNSPAQNLTYMLGVYETGGWIVKTVVTTPLNEQSPKNACAYLARASIGQANQISQK